ncbi:alpha/beta fold hydrolase [Maribacter sp. 2307UL18-2]|uniref:alpha/beta fold hydrolase n=1 Tax=Maribacter sp. 2307UL18-2 TaxID=3386274 RepID=UPI0039BC69C2
MKKIIILIGYTLLLATIYAQRAEYADLNGIKLHYQTQGSGEPLLLLHNFTSSHKVWEPWLRDLAKQYTLILPDMRGHGKSTNPSNLFTHEQSAKDMYALMDALKIEKFKAIGASSGGMTLVHMATMDSTRIESMILVGATSHFGQPCRQIMANSQFETVSEDWMLDMKKHQPEGDAQIKRLLGQFNAMQNSYDDMNFTAPYLSQIKCPTLIVHGELDEFFPLEIPFAMARAIPKASLWIVPNGGHLPIWDARWADIFLDTSKSFLKGEL